MDGLSRPAAGDTPLTILGEQILVPTFTLRDFGTVENHLLQIRRKEKIAIAAAAYNDLPPEIGMALLQEARAEAEKMREISAEEVREWIDPPLKGSPGVAKLEGPAFTIWILVNKARPGKYSLEQIEEYVFNLAENDLYELIRARDQAATLDLAPNSISPSAVPEETGNGEASGQPGGKCSTT